jgi:hypothetical protein
MPSRKRSIFELIQDVSIKTKTAIFPCTACNNIIYQGLLSFGSPDPPFGPYFPKKMKVRKYGQYAESFTTFDEFYK